MDGAPHGWVSTRRSVLAPSPRRNPSTPTDGRFTPRVEEPRKCHGSSTPPGGVFRRLDPPGGRSRSRRGWGSVPRALPSPVMHRLRDPVTGDIDHPRGLAQQSVKVFGAIVEWCCRILSQPILDLFAVYFQAEGGDHGDHPVERGIGQPPRLPDAPSHTAVLTGKPDLRHLMLPKPRCACPSG